MRLSTPTSCKLIKGCLPTYPTIVLMLACGVPWSAKDYVNYSPTRDRSPCTKPLLNFEVGYPAQVPPGCAD
eukprot:1080845-Pleurochrysis_carterae.AAC.1